MIGIFGYLDFTTSTTDDILVNYCIHITHDLLMTAGKNDADDDYNLNKGPTS